MVKMLHRLLSRGREREREELQDAFFLKLNSEEQVKRPDDDEDDNNKRLGNFGE